MSVEFIMYGWNGSLDYSNVNNLSIFCNLPSGFSTRNDIKNLIQLNIHPTNETGINCNDIEKILQKSYSLEILKLRYCGITDSTLFFISETNLKIRELELEGVLINDEGLQFLFVLEKLEFLSLKNCFGITDFGINLIFENFPNLKKLNIEGIEEIHYSTIDKLKNRGIDIIS